MAAHRISDSLRRAPNGVLSDKPIPIRLKPEERTRAEAGARQEQRSLASFCRLMFLQGLADYENGTGCITPSQPEH